MEPEPTLAELGEWELIARLAAFAPAGQFNDDAALLAAGGTLVVNTDVLVEDVHFSEATTDGRAVGWRATAANLSDLAAMGCNGAEGITVGLVAPGSTPWPWVAAVYGGLRACLEAHGGTLLGGDCSAGGQRLLAITALGRLGTSRRGEATVIRRGDGQPGDVLVSTGPHGLSRLGLALLQATLAPATRQLVPPALASRATDRHRQPVPRFDAVRALQASQPPRQPWRVGGTDSSDGLGAAVAAIAATSGCQAVLERTALPLDPAMAVLPEAEAWCLAGGEDFELVLALEPRWAEALLERLPGSQTIGRLLEQPAGEAPVVWADGGGAVTGAGYSHFR